MVTQVFNQETWDAAHSLVEEMVGLRSLMLRAEKGTGGDQAVMGMYSASGHPDYYCQIKSVEANPASPDPLFSWIDEESMKRPFPGHFRIEIRRPDPGGSIRGYGYQLFITQEELPALRELVAIKHQQVKEELDMKDSHRQELASVERGPNATPSPG